MTAWTSFKTKMPPIGKRVVCLQRCVDTHILRFVIKGYVGGCWIVEYPHSSYMDIAWVEMPTEEEIEECLNK